MNESFNIAVVGSGAAGIAAAVSAARAGARVLLLDKNTGVGGTGGFSGLTTLCGLFDDAGNYLNAGFAGEFAKAIAESPPMKSGRLWILPYRPEKFRTVAGEFFTACPTLKTTWNTPLKSARVENGLLVSLNSFPVGAVIDCSGMAEVARAVGAKCMETDEATQAPAVVFTLLDVKRDIFTPADAAKILLPLARAGFPPLYFHRSLELDCITAKFCGSPEQVPVLIEFLRVNVPGFESCSSSQKEYTVSRRAGRMIVGEYVLTGEDVLRGQKVPDAAARCAWPIEQWDANGNTRLRWLPADASYEIPARSLRAATIKNLFMAGKTISADVDAIASARVMGCCLATGEAAGKLAADCLNSPR